MVHAGRVGAGPTDERSNAGRQDVCDKGRRCGSRAALRFKRRICYYTWCELGGGPAFRQVRPVGFRCPAAVPGFRWLIRMD